MKSVILVAQGVQDEEFIYPYYRLQEEGSVVVVASIRENKRETKDNLTGKYGIPIGVNASTENLNSHSDANLVIIPGGWQCPEILRTDPYVINYIKDMHAKYSIIGAICHGPQVLISAGIIDNKRIGCYVGIKDDVINANAIYENIGLVIHENIITAPHYNNNPEFVKACIDAVRKSTG